MNLFKTSLSKFLIRISILTLFTCQAVLSEELTNVKIIGGFSAECSETSPGPLNSLQPLIFKILNSKKSGDSLVVEFEVQFVECSKNKWSMLKSITTEFNNAITDEVGQNIKEKISFNKFRIQVLNTKSSAIQTIPISIEKKANFKFKINVKNRDIEKDPESKGKYIDVMLMADRKRNTSADYYFEEVNWGRVRLQLDQQPTH